MVWHDSMRDHLCMSALDHYLFILRNGLIVWLGVAHRTVLPDVQSRSTIRLGAAVRCELRKCGGCARSALHMRQLDLGPISADLGSMGRAGWRSSPGKKRLLLAVVSFFVTKSTIVERIWWNVGR